MKILVTGQNSYAGKQFAKRITELNKGYEINFVSVRDDLWKKNDFSYYDAVYHVAGIVHKKETAENRNLYYKVNRELTYQIALKAKNEGVKSFVFLSTMAVYGLIGKIGKETIISKETKASPASHYGKSKLEAERLLIGLQSTGFNVSILRIPMVYGPSCPGNYSSLSKLVRKTPVFPKINNRRSMIFIDYLSDVVIYIMEKKLSGTFLVKNPDDINTIEMINEISRVHKKWTYNSVLLGFIVKSLGNNFILTRKMFSSVFYRDIDCIIKGYEFNKLTFGESISMSEGIEQGDNN